MKDQRFINLSGLWTSMNQVSAPKPHEKLNDLLALVNITYSLRRMFATGVDRNFNKLFVEFVEEGNKDYKEQFIETFTNLKSTKMEYNHKGFSESAIKQDVTERAEHIDSFRDWSGIGYVHSMISAYWQGQDQVASDPYGLFEYVIKAGLLELPEKYRLPLGVINSAETPVHVKEGSLEDEAFHFMSVLNLFERITDGKSDDDMKHLNVKYVLKTGSAQHENTSDIHNNNSVFSEFASDADLLRMIDTYR